MMTLPLVIEFKTWDLRLLAVAYCEAMKGRKTSKNMAEHLYRIYEFSVSDSCKSGEKCLSQPTSTN